MFVVKPTEQIVTLPSGCAARILRYVSFASGAVSLEGCFTTSLRAFTMSA